MRRLLAGFLAVALAFVTPGVPVMAADEPAREKNREHVAVEKMYDAKSEVTRDAVVSGDFEYEINADNTATLTSYTGTATELVIPSTIDGYTVTAIGYECFYYQATIINVVIPDSVISIGDWAFQESVIESITIGKNVEYIGYGAFYCCEYLTSITIPASVTEMVAPFGDNYALTNISVEAGNVSYKVVNNCLFTMDGTTVVVYPMGSTATSYVVPNGVTAIGEGAFDGAKNLTNIVLPKGLTDIGPYGFDDCSGLKKIDIPESVTYIGNDAFYYCTSLESIVIPSSVTVIDKWVFFGCESLKWITLPAGITDIDYEAFGSCSMLTDVYYGGNAQELTNVSIGSDNEYLTNATIHYNWSLEGFVERMYTIALNRASDEGGLAVWTAALKAETHDCAKIAAEFLLGEEFKLRGLSNEAYVDVLYKTFFNREADAEGKKLWTDVLNAGNSREFVLSRFVNLNEFKNLCATFGIKQGVMFDNGTVATSGVSQFVNRLYENVLGREAEAEGLYNWALALTVGSESAKSAAMNFFNSEEYVLKNTDNRTYVSDLYILFMNRGADEGGLAVWTAALDQGTSRTQVLESFASSQEFAIIAASYGLK